MSMTLRLPGAVIDMRVANHPASSCEASPQPKLTAALAEFDPPKGRGILARASLPFWYSSVPVGGTRLIAT